MPRDTCDVTQVGAGLAGIFDGGFAPKPRAGTPTSCFRFDRYAVWPRDPRELQQVGAGLAGIFDGGFAPKPRAGTPTPRRFSFDRRAMARLEACSW
jgi:hypothetical protein